MAFFISRAMKIMVRHNKNVQQRTKYEVKFKLQCDALKPCHAYVNEMMRHEIIKSIRNSENGNLWNDRQDTYLDIDVFFIENDIKINHEITVYFSLIVSCYGDKRRATTVVTKLGNTIEQFGQIGSNIQRLLQKSFHGQMKLENVRASSIKIYDLKTILNETIFGNNKSGGRRSVNINKSIRGRAMAPSMTQSSVNSNGAGHDHDHDDDEKASQIEIVSGPISPGTVISAEGNQAGQVYQYHDDD